MIPKESKKEDIGKRGYRSIDMAFQGNKYIY